MASVLIPAIKCCKGCTKRSIEPNCHSYCPTYLAEKLERDSQLEKNRKVSRAALDADDTRWNSYWRRQKRRRH